MAYGGAEDNFLTAVHLTDLLLTPPLSLIVLTWNQKPERQLAVMTI